MVDVETVSATRRKLPLRAGLSRAVGNQHHRGLADAEEHSFASASVTHHRGRPGRSIDAVWGRSD